MGKVGKNGRFSPSVCLGVFRLNSEVFADLGVKKKNQHLHFKVLEEFLQLIVAAEWFF